MKNSIKSIIKLQIISIVVFISIFLNTATCQITKITNNVVSTSIGEVKDFGGWWASMSMYTTEKDTSYGIAFLNTKYSTINDIKSFTFKQVDNDFNYLYKLICDTISAVKKTSVDLQLEKGLLTLNFDVSMGAGGVAFVWEENYVRSTSRYFSRKQIDKLFGKL